MGDGWVGGWVMDVWMDGWVDISEVLTASQKNIQKFQEFNLY